MASSPGLVALILLHGIEVTVQFPFPMGNLQATNDLVGCTVQLIREYHNNLNTLRIYQSTSPTLSLVSVMIRKHISQNHHPYPVTTTSIEATHSLLPVIEKMCLAVIDTQSELDIIVKNLYQKYHHKRVIICLTYGISNPVQYLIDVNKKIWTKGVPRNIIFIVKNNENSEIWIIGVSGYVKRNCQSLDMIQVGQYHHGVLTKFKTDFYPNINVLGGCELSVMVQPPFLPYVVTKDDRHPSGIVGELMGMLGISMNFTTKYVWSSTSAAMINHLDESDLNLFMDMVPRATIAATNYRFSVGMTQVTFIVPINGKRESTMGKLLLPFDNFVWLSTFCVLICFMVLSILARDVNFGSVLLKIFGTLMGVSVGAFPNSNWIRIFLWFWLLPSYVLVQSYLACLTKQFTIPPKSIEINTLNELLKSNLNILCGIGTKTAVCNLDEPLFKRLCKKCVLASDETIWDEFYPNFFKSGMMNGTAVISNLDFIKAYRASLNAHAIIENPTDVNQLVEVKPGGDYIFMMKRKFERLFACGLIQFWRGRYSNSGQYQAINGFDSYMQREFIECGIVIHIVGLTISIICFITEIIIHRFVE